MHGALPRTLASAQAARATSAYATPIRPSPTRARASRRRVTATRTASEGPPRGRATVRPTSRGTLSAMGKDHPRDLGPRIAADYRLLNYLRGRSTQTVDAIAPGSMRIEVEGGQ